jgi:hypothetical protein
MENRLEVFMAETGRGENWKEKNVTKGYKIFFWSDKNDVKSIVANTLKSIELYTLN